MTNLPEQAKGEPMFNPELARGLTEGLNDLLRDLNGPLEKVQKYFNAKMSANSSSSNGTKGNKLSSPIEPLFRDMTVPKQD